MVLPYLRQSLRAAPGVAWVTALLTGLTAWVVSQQVPMRWVAEAELVVTEPLIFERLAAPFTGVPDPDVALATTAEAMQSTERMVALAKGAALLDRWEDELPWSLAAWRSLRRAVGAPWSEREELEALVATLQQHTSTEVRGRHIVLRAEWVTPEMALWLARAQLEALVHRRPRQELEVAERGLAAMEERWALVSQENADRRARLERAQLEADQAGRPVDLSAEFQGLMEAAAREHELLVRTSEARLGRDVAARAMELRHLLLRPPTLPVRPASAPRWKVVLSGVLVMGAMAVGGPILLALWRRRFVTPGHVAQETGLPLLGQLTLADDAGPRPGPAAWAWLALLALTSGVGTVLPSGGFLLGLAPLAVALVAWAIWTQPLTWPVLGLLLGAVTLDDPTDRPYAGMWRSPLLPLGRLLFGNVALFTGMELAVYGLLGLMFLRRVRRSSVDPPAPPTPRALRLTLLLSAAAVLALVAFGLVRGGSFRFALWQFRYLLLLPAFAVLALRALEFPRDLGKLLGVLLLGSVVKTGMAAWFIAVVATPAGLEPPHTTGHNDTMLYVTAACAPLLLLWERPTRQHLLLAALWLPLTVLAITLNDRRIAWVELALCAGMVLAVSPRNVMKRWVLRVAVVALPVGLLYLGAGWNTRGGHLFAPAQKVRNILAPPEGTVDQTSNADRDTENYNLRRSWELNPVVGQGFGHAFIEFRPFNDFRASNFGQIGHNSLMWLLWIGGLVGFLLVVLYLGITSFYLGRTLPRLAAPAERSALLLALCILVTYLGQAFGDMGTQSAAIDLFVGVAVAMVGQFAGRVGADRVDPPSSLPLQDTRPPFSSA